MERETCRHVRATQRSDLTFEGHMKVGPTSVWVPFQRKLKFETWGGRKYPKGITHIRTQRLTAYGNMLFIMSILFHFNHHVDH